MPEEEIQTEPAQGRAMEPPQGFPMHRAEIVPGGLKYEIWLDQLTCISHVLPDAQFMQLFKLLRDRRKQEEATKITIAHTLPKGRLN